MGIVALLIVIIGIACLAGGAWLVYTGALIAGIVLAVIGLVILYGGHHGGHYGGYGRSNTTL